MPQAIRIIDNFAELSGQVMAGQLGIAPDALVVVQRGETDEATGDNLKAAYAAAKALTPGGQALSATNRAAVGLIGRARLSRTGVNPGMTLDASYVDLVGGTPNATIYSVSVAAGDEGATLYQTASDVRLTHLTVAVQRYQIDAGTERGANALRIADNVIASVQTGDVRFYYDSDLELYKLSKSGAFTNVQVGDYAEMWHATMALQPRRSWPVVQKISNNVIAITPSVAVNNPPIPEYPGWADFNVIVRRNVNPASVYTDVVFVNYSSLTLGYDLYPEESALEGSSALIYGEGHLTGLWVRCKGVGMRAWYVGTRRHLLGTWIDCEAGTYSWGARPGRGADWSWGYLQGTWRWCSGGTRSFGGEFDYGCQVLPEAVITDGSCGYQSIASGNVMAGLVRNMTVGAGCIAGGYELGNMCPGCVTGTVDNVVGAGGATMGAGPAGAAWQANTSYPMGSVIQPTTPNGYRYQQIWDAPRLSGASEPNWPTYIGHVVADNECLWMCIANTGMLSRLEAGLSESMILKGTTLRDCSLKTTGGNKDCLVLMDGNSIIRRCVLEAHGTGKSVKAASAQNVKITHSHIPQGLGTNVTNTETNPCNSGV